MKDEDELLQINYSLMYLKYELNWNKIGLNRQKAINKYPAFIVHIMYKNICIWPVHNTTILDELYFQTIPVCLQSYHMGLHHHPWYPSIISGCHSDIATKDDWDGWILFEMDLVNYAVGDHIIANFSYTVYSEHPRYFIPCIKWAIPDKFCPPSIEDVNASYAKSLEFHWQFKYFFLEI